VRGGADFESPVRRAHLHGYGIQERSPDIGSFSPASVLFQAGGGYENSPRFLDAQLSHFLNYGVRPEVEVFNGNILDQALGDYWHRLQETGEPALFMLVAGVDQHRRTNYGSVEDDSLIPVTERKAIFQLITDDSDDARRQAIQRTVTYLRPIVDRIRAQAPGAVISTLAPGPMLQILPEIALALRLDGVRVGLEDALNVPDDRVPGGLRKASTADQVRYVRQRLEALGIRILNAEQTRERLRMPREDVSLFRAAAKALVPLLPKEPPEKPRAIASLVLAALRPLRDQYAQKEARFISSLQLYREIADTSDRAAATEQLTEMVVQAISESGLHVRYFIEERDRYPGPLKNFGQRVYPLQALNFIRELLTEHGYPTATWDQILETLARTDGLAEDAYLIKTSQHKGLDLRFLEYLTSLSSRYNQTRTLAVNTILRTDENYSAVMATLFEAVTELLSKLRRSSAAEAKQAGIRAFQVLGKERTEIDHHTLYRSLLKHPWMVLPSTPTTNYPEGITLATGLTSTFARFLSSITQSQDNLIGFVHSGLDDQGDPIIESVMLHNRFALNTPWHSRILGHSARLIYEHVLLPRVAEHPERLARSGVSSVKRSTSGFPLYTNGQPAAKLSFQGIEDLNRLHLFAHSSGVATIQQLDSALRADLVVLGYSELEQDEIINRAVAISFGSASDVNLQLPGTPIADITAYNDIRSLAGTTTLDYLPSTEHERLATIDLLHCGIPEGHRYSQAYWVLYKNGASRRLLRLKGVVLREDPVRTHDGHSIRRYLEGAPTSVFDLIRLFHEAPPNLRADMLMREFYDRQQVT